MDGHKTHTGGSFGAEHDRVTVRGVLLFFWDSGDPADADHGHTVVNIESDDPLMPDAYELTGEVRAAVLEILEVGRRIEIDYLVEHHEIVDPDGVVTDGHRPLILQVRISDRP